MTTRREFLRLTMAGASALAFANRLHGFASHQPIGLQLYTVREQVAQDLENTLRRIRAIGYEEVELFPTVYNRSAAELRQVLQNTGLKAPSAHFDYKGLTERIEFAKGIGVKYMVCSMLPRELWSADGLKQAAEQLNRLGEQVQQHGMVLGYHNHNFEFRKFGDQTGLEILMAHSNPKLVKLEMDCYWVVQAGQDPTALMNKYGDRIRLLHIKDRKPGFAASQNMDEGAAHFAEFGTGSIDWKPILAKAKAIGVEHYFVEQDRTDRPVMESIKISYQHAREML